MEKVIVSILSAIAIVGIIAVLLGFPIMWLWDWLMPELFGLKEITFWQAVGINLLTGLLFRESNSYSSKE